MYAIRSYYDAGEVAAEGKVLAERVRPGRGLVDEARHGAAVRVVEGPREGLPQVEDAVAVGVAGDVGVNEIEAVGKRRRRSYNFV